MHFQKLYPQLTTASEPEVCSLLQIQSVGSLGYWRMNIGVGNMLTLALQALFSNLILDRQLQSEKTVFTSCQADTWAFFLLDCEWCLDLVEDESQRKEFFLVISRSAALQLDLKQDSSCVSWSGR